jgi:hypothetical protein
MLDGHVAALVSPQSPPSPPSPTIPKARSAVEIELLSLLSHARSCDGIRCKMCSEIDRRVGDGRYGVDNPFERYAVATRAVTQVARDYERLTSILDAVSLQPGVRRAVHDHAKKLEQIGGLLRLPITRGERVVYARRAPVRRAYTG